MTLKEKTLHQYKQMLQDKIDVFRDRIAALTDDSKNDAKGSAGDKHETALSMMHLEQEKANYKLREYINQLEVLNRISIDNKSEKVILGSFVKINAMHVFVSDGLPKITIDGCTIYGISRESPLCGKIMGQKVGFTFALNGSDFKIESIE